MPLLLQGTAFVLRGRSFRINSRLNIWRPSFPRRAVHVPFFCPSAGRRLAVPLRPGWFLRGAADLDVVQQFYERFRVKIHSLRHD